MLLLLYRGYTHLSAPLWLTTQNIFSTRLWCVWESVCVYVRDSVKNECWSTWNLFIECIVVFFFFKIVLENIGEIIMIEKSTYFYSDEASLDPICA